MSHYGMGKHIILVTDPYGLMTVKILYAQRGVYANYDSRAL